MSNSLQSVDRALAVLDILARAGDLGVTEVAAELDVHKSTASRLLAALEQRELVEQDGDRGRYRLGLGLMRLAHAVAGKPDLVRQTRPVLEDLAERVGETVNLAVLRGHHAVNVDQAQGPSAVAAQNWTGALTPLHATSNGKVLLAAQTPARRTRLLDAAELVRYTPHTIVNRRELLEELDTTDVDGYGTAFGELEIGLNAVAVPVHDHTGDVVASLCVSGPAYRLDRDAVSAVLDDLVDAGELVSRQLGHAVPARSGHLSRPRR